MHYAFLACEADGRVALAQLIFCQDEAAVEATLKRFSAQTVDKGIGESVTYLSEETLEQLLRLNDGEKYVPES